MWKEGGRFERLRFNLTFSQKQRSQAEKKQSVKCRCNIFCNICFLLSHNKLVFTLYDLLSALKWHKLLYLKKIYFKGQALDCWARLWSWTLKKMKNYSRVAQAFVLLHQSTSLTDPHIQRVYPLQICWPVTMPSGQLRISHVNVSVYSTWFYRKLWVYVRHILFFLNKKINLHILFF